jgi:hypothetical protein
MKSAKQPLSPFSLMRKKKEVNETASKPLLPDEKEVK